MTYDTIKFEVGLPEYCSFPDTVSCLNLVKAIGFLRLAGPDGCSCGHLDLGGVTIHVSCYKSSGEVCVDCEDSELEDLMRIGEEVLHQVADVEDPEVTKYRRERYKLIINGKRRTTAQEKLNA